MFVLDAQKNLLFEKVLLSAQSIYFDLEMRFSYELLSGGLINLQ